MKHSLEGLRAIFNIFRQELLIADIALVFSNSPAFDRFPAKAHQGFSVSSRSLFSTRQKKTLKNHLDAVRIKLGGEVEANYFGLLASFLRPALATRWYDKLWEMFGL